MFVVGASGRVSSAVSSDMYGTEAGLLGNEKACMSLIHELTLLVFVFVDKHHQIQSMPSVVGALVLAYPNRLVLECIN